MLRFIIKNTTGEINSGSKLEEFSTLDVDVPALEKILAGGGYSTSGFFEFSSLIGAEIIYLDVAQQPQAQKSVSDSSPVSVASPTDDDELPF